MVVVTVLPDDRPRYEQSSVVPFVHVDGELSVVLITSLRHQRWILPKGVVDPGFTPIEAALNEAHEEAGLVGVVEGEAVGSYEYEKWGGVCSVEVFAMRVTEVLDDWLEKAMRERRIVPAADVPAMVRPPELAAIVEEAIAGARGC